MFLKIKGTSIAEVLIALVIISLCYGIVAVVFARMSKIPLSHDDICDQTEIMNRCWNNQIGLKDTNMGDQYHQEVVVHQSFEDIEFVTFKNFNGTVLWQNERLIIQ